MTLIQRICAGASTAVIASSAGSVISYSVTIPEAKLVEKQNTKVKTASRYSEFLDWPSSPSENSLKDLTTWF